MASDTILVVGATGNVGLGLVPALRARGAKVRALAHTEAKAQALRAQGVETFVGDLDQPHTLEAAVAGVDNVYLITWNGPTAAAQAGNVIAAAKQAGRPHIVRQSGYGPETSRIIAQHIQVEEQLKASGLPYTIVAPTFFMQNLMMAAQTIASDGMMYLPFKDGRLGMVDVRDIVEVATTVLTTAGHEGKKYVLTGPQSVTCHDVAAAFTEALGKPVTYVDVPTEAAKQSMLGMGMPEWIADGFAELFEGFARNWADRVSPDVERITGRPGRSIRQFAQDFAAYFGGVPAGAAAAR